MYVDAKLIKGRIHVSSYKDGKRSVTTHLPPYVFYYADDHGTYTSIYHDKLKQKRLTDRKKFWRELEDYKRRRIPIFESDVNPVFRLLEERFPTNDTPPLNVSFIDIECDKDPSKGWSNVASPYAIVNAITIYNTWENDGAGQYYTIAVAPPNMTRDEAAELLAQDNDEDSFGCMNEGEGYFVARSELELLDMTLALIADSDVITGWNSTFFDLPYLIQRVRMVMGGEKLSWIEREDGSDEKPFRPSHRSRPHLERFNLEGFPCLPEMRMVERFGNAEKTFDIFGRVHLDYLELYRKFTFEELHSYTLDNVLQREVGQTKVQYEGSLDQLYRNDFRTFIAYNRQDVAGLVAMDRKLKMIDLANTMAHMAGVTFDKVFGSVAIIEQAILKELHKQNLICFDRSDDHEDDGLGIPGAFVVDPDAGVYDWIASFDINSLYPSVIRSLNISPERVVGQFDTPETREKLRMLLGTGMKPSEAWGHFTGVTEYHYLDDETDDMLTLKIEGTEDEFSATAKEWKARLRQNGWAVSANGTVLDLSEDGIVPFCLTKWYAQRKEWQGEKKARKSAQDGKDGAELAKLKDEESYYDMIQMVMKIFLNSTYGALLNRFCRFYDPRLGKSVTLTGRVITKHMCREASRCMTGNYDFDKRAVIYGDTDSSYCTLDWYMGHEGIEKNVDNAVEIADGIGDKVNASFPKFMDQATLVGEKRGAIIEAGREVVGRKGLFKEVKKRYAIHVVDLEGFRTNKIKIMGMEVRRSDTPKVVQDFLEECIAAVIRDDKGYDEVYEMVQEFREQWRAVPAWKRGTPCRVSKLTINSRKINAYEELREEGYVDIKKPTTHFSVVAANNTNLLMQQHDEHRWDIIRDGDKIEVLYLRPNEYDIKSVAIKVGENYVPDWFQALPFDDVRHEQKMIDKKLDNVLGSVVGWTFEPVQDFRQEVFEEVDFLDL